METLIKDIRFGIRSLLKRPGFTAVALITLALGIGANTAVFSVVNAFLLRPLPYGEPDRLVMVDSQYRGTSIGVSFLDYEDWRTQNHVFADMAFFNLRWNANLELGRETETLNLTFGTPNLFSVLRVAPLIGHGPQTETPDTVLISHRLWQRRFGSDPKILGRQLRIEGQGLTVILSRHYQQLLQRVAIVPGVVAVAANSDPPFVGQKPWYRGDVSIAGQPVDERKQNPLVNYQAVSPDYFQVMQIPLIRGRFFTEQDTVRPDGRRDVAIVNRRLAERLWPNADPIGKRLNCDEEDNACAAIVGVVGDVKHNGLKDEAGYDLYYSCYQSYSKQIHFLARTQGDPLSLAPAIKQAIWEVAPDTGVFNVIPLSQLSANTIWQPRLWGLLSGNRKYCHGNTL